MVGNLEHDGCEMTNLLITNASFPTPIAELPSYYTNADIVDTANRLNGLLRRYEAEMLSTPERA